MIEATALVDKFRYALDNKWGYIWGTAGILWTKARQKQKVDYMVNKYGTSWQKNSEAKNDHYYSAAMEGSKWIDHDVADCSGLFVWAFKQLGGSIYHGSNSIYDRYCTAKGDLSAGMRKDGKDLLIGTAVFTNHNGDKTHIGLYVGGGKVIEASGTVAGVCTSNITAGKWKCWGELKDVKYGEQPEPGPTPTPEPQYPTLRKGDKGEWVAVLQQKLMTLGYNLGPCGIDGDFGKATEAALKLFQQDWGLEKDGICGPKSWGMLNSVPLTKESYSVTLTGLDLTQAKAIVNNYPGRSSIKEE